jgi:hypothetical protein
MSARHQVAAVAVHDRHEVAGAGGERRQGEDMRGRRP